MTAWQHWTDQLERATKEESMANRMYTVIGLWSDGEPLAAGAIEGEHEVAGDLDYYGFQPWATSTEAADADEAMEYAVEQMRDERDRGNEA